MRNIEKYIRKKQNVFAVEIRLKCKYYTKTFKSLEQAQLYKEKVLKGEEKNSCYYYKFKNKWYYTSHQKDFLFVKEKLNDFNPELFDLSFIDFKYKLSNKDIVRNILTTF